MKITRGMFILFIVLTIFICNPPNSPFVDPDNVSLTIYKPDKKKDRYKYCVNDKVTFEATIKFPHLVKKIAIIYDEHSERDEQEIKTNERNAMKISFSYTYKEKGTKNVIFIITLQETGKEKVFRHSVTIGIKPTIKNLITLGEIKLGQQTALTVEHKVFGETSYEWFKGETRISGEYNNTLIFKPLKASDAGEYYCIVKSPWGQDTSKKYTIHFNKSINPPQIQLHPQDQQVTAGNSARFTIKATGEKISYQWQKNEVDISGAHDILYEVNDLNIGDEATYRCIVSNSAGNDTSKNAILEVFKKEVAPKIEKHPKNQDIEEGNTVHFSIKSEGTNLKYQWFKDEVKIEKATAASFEIDQVSKDDDGKVFHCVVSNREGKEVSNKATLTVRRISKPEIEKQPKSLEVTSGNEARFLVVAKGGNLRYQWQEDNKNISGANEPEYIHKNAKKEDNGKRFRCIVSNSAGKATSKEAVLEVNEKIIAPKITKQPVNITVKEGEEATFSVIATGTNITYQWYKDNKKISGANKSRYRVKGERELSGLNFYCIVSNAEGTVESNTVALTVRFRLLIKITFDKDGGDGDAPSKEVYQNDNVTLPADIKKSGYIFKGWKNGSVIYDAGNSYTVTGTENITFKAVWEKKARTLDGFVVWAEGGDCERGLVFSRIENGNVGEKKIAVKKHIADCWVHISYDGVWIAFCRVDQAFKGRYGQCDYHNFIKWDIYIAKIDNGKNLPATPIKVAHGYWPSWGDDSHIPNKSKTLYFTHYESKSIKKTVINPDGTFTPPENHHTFKQIMGTSSHIQMSPNGKFILYRPTKMEVYSLELKKSISGNLGGFHPSWGPRSRYFILSINEAFLNLGTSVKNLGPAGVGSSWHGISNDAYYDEGKLWVIGRIGGNGHNGAGSIEFREVDISNDGWKFGNSIKVGSGTSCDIHIWGPEGSP
jgi:hypothetical protein